MQKTSGLILDVHDDVGGDVLRTIFPRADVIPEMVKSAHLLTSDERQRLPDELHALVLMDGDQKMRKFACHDAGNTALSVLYFLKTAHKLPEEAVRVGAENLKVACEWYGLDIPEELEEKAAGVVKEKGLKRVGQLLSGSREKSLGKAVSGRLSAGSRHDEGSLNPMFRDGVAAGTRESSKRFQAAADRYGSALKYQRERVKEHKAVVDTKITAGVGAAGAALGGVAALSKKKEASIGKMLTAIQLPGAISNTSKNIQGNMAGIRASEAHGNAVTTMEQMKGKHAEVSGTTDMPFTDPGTNAKPRMPVKKASMSPYVDVTGKDAHRDSPANTVTHYALEGRYPLDNYDQVKTAAAYFDEYVGHFDADERREYCVNLVKRANDLGVTVSKTARQYAGTEYADDDHLKMAMRTRIEATDDHGAHRILGALFEKKAEILPEMFAAALYEFDKAAGLTHLYDRTVFDPFVSVLQEKTAEEDDWSDVIGNDFVTSAQLKFLSKAGRALIAKTFGEDLAGEFMKDPVGIYKSLPRDQKKILARMASDDTSLSVHL